ncbi:uncharacterized protein STEHIDRAFT_159224 [Stereum hirsutum FP-91666 SS1]|uniref:uncharacterized protein n=1 Tax=Stereum hirsutum (strain FP-91666) TaxID=721885 RepID=UPI0004449826|nr:uncharacterized protein STEHIDRAFT_159224 [Stereum hirsutum FP-91666 SS1]EIM84559.1 hypothetical protein STEHIDRAFT_159224 [Stereum hirsutum FP-91666 SS1]
MAEAREELNRMFRQSQPVSSIPASHHPYPPPPPTSPGSYSSSLSAGNYTGDTSFKTESTSDSSRRTGDSIKVKFSTNGQSARAAGSSFQFRYGHGATADSHSLSPPLKINTFIPATEDDIFNLEQFINTLNPRSRFVSQSRHRYYAIARGRVRTIVGTFEEMYLLTRRLPFEPVVQGFFNFDAAKAWILTH